MGERKAAKKEARLWTMKDGDGDGDSDSDRDGDADADADADSHEL